MIVKNWNIDKTNLCTDSRVGEGELIRESTLFCHCETHEYCPVQELLEYVEAMKDGINVMKHPNGGTDGLCSQLISPIY